MDITCVAGLQDSLIDMIQMFGWIVRTFQAIGLAVLFYENWVNEISMDEYNNGDLHDLDRPRNKLHKNSTPWERASYSSVKLLKLATCIRASFAQYLNDTTEESKCIICLCDTI